MRDPQSSSHSHNRNRQGAVPGDGPGMRDPTPAAAGAAKSAADITDILETSVGLAGGGSVAMSSSPSPLRGTSKARKLMSQLRSPTPAASSHSHGRSHSHNDGNSGSGGGGGGGGGGSPVPAAPLSPTRPRRTGRGGSGEGTTSSLSPMQQQQQQQQQQQHATSLARRRTAATTTSAAAAAAVSGPGSGSASVQSVHAATAAVTAAHAQAPTLALHFTMSVHSVGVSLIDQTPQELLYVSIHDTRLEFLQYSSARMTTGPLCIVCCFFKIQYTVRPCTPSYLLSVSPHTLHLPFLPLTLPNPQPLSQIPWPSPLLACHSFNSTPRCANSTDTLTKLILLHNTA